MSVKHMMYSDNMEAEMCTKIVSYLFHNSVNVPSLKFHFPWSVFSILDFSHRKNRVVPIKYKLFKYIQKNNSGYY